MFYKYRHFVAEARGWVQASPPPGPSISREFDLGFAYLFRGVLREQESRARELFERDIVDSAWLFTAWFSGCCCMAFAQERPTESMNAVKFWVGYSLSFFNTIYGHALWHISHKAHTLKYPVSIAIPMRKFLGEEGHSGHTPKGPLSQPHPTPFSTAADIRNAFNAGNEALRPSGPSPISRAWPSSSCCSFLSLNACSASRTFDCSRKDKLLPA